MILKRFVDNTMIFLLKNWVVLNFCSRLYNNKKPKQQTNKKQKTVLFNTYLLMILSASEFVFF